MVSNPRERDEAIMFCRNANYQISMFDPLNRMPKYLIDILKNSWCHAFREYIFPKINEERFSVLYSDNPATRPNSPVNVIIGLLIIKEIFQDSDEELIGSLHFDIRYQYALHTTSLERQPVSINTLSNFRKRVVEYEKETGRDLIKEEVEALAEVIAQYMKIDGKKIRVDSLMVSSSCKKLSRMELIYSLNERMVKLLQEIDPESIPESCAGYLEAGYKNEVIYRTKDTEADKKIEVLISQAVDLYYASNKKEVIESEEYKMLERFFREQTEVLEGKFSIKEAKEIPSDSLQNPTDPDATYRKKYNKGNIGYVANVVESFNEEGGVIIQYDLRQNIYSDQQFAKDTIERLPEGEAGNETKVIVDGTYYSEEIAQKALEKNIEMIPTGLTGKKPSEDKMDYSEYKVDEARNVIIGCPGGEEPYASYNSKGNYKAYFEVEKCKRCPLKDRCRVKITERKAVVRISEKAYRLSLLRVKMGTEEYRRIASQRAGIEGIPSVLRRKYKVDFMPVRGLLRSKLWFGFKIAAMNFKSLLKWIKKDPKNRLTPSFLHSFLYLCSSVWLFFDNRFKKFYLEPILFVG
jgi:hypothetical protein